MQEVVLDGVPPLRIALRRMARARRITLRVSALDGRITLTLPTRVSIREALDFARQKEAWIRGHLSGATAQEAVDLGSEIPFEGGLLTVAPAQGRRVSLSGETLFVPPDRVSARVAAFLKDRARARLVAASDLYAGRLARSYTKITLRDTRSRWGSCSSSGRLMYSWRLILAPPPVLQYVTAHEVAHLAEMNHSARFWETVERIHGPYHAPRRWLRDEGAGLHRFVFQD